MKTYNDIWSAGSCTICGKITGIFDMFPGGRCRPCWEKIFTVRSNGGAVKGGAK